MKTLTIKLTDYLEVDGWDFAEHVTEDLEWWTDEIWQLKSAGHQWAQWHLSLFSLIRGGTATVAREKVSGRSRAALNCLAT